MDGLPARAHTVLEGSLTAPAQARALVSETLDADGLDTVERARLVTSELVSMAVRHGSPRVALTVQAGEREVRIEVAEQTLELDGAPAAALVEDDREDERTTRVVEAIAARQGRDMRSGGMTVWAEIPRA